jgi:hypothetical protein
LDVSRSQTVNPSEGSGHGSGPSSCQGRPHTPGWAVAAGSRPWSSAPAPTAADADPRSVSPAGKQPDCLGRVPPSPAACPRCASERVLIVGVASSSRQPTTRPTYPLLTMSAGAASRMPSRPPAVLVALDHGWLSRSFGQQVGQSAWRLPVTIAAVARQRIFQRCRPVDPDHVDGGQLIRMRAARKSKDRPTMSGTEAAPRQTWSAPGTSR